MAAEIGGERRRRWSRRFFFISYKSNLLKGTMHERNHVKFSTFQLYEYDNFFLRIYLFTIKYLYIKKDSFISPFIYLHEINVQRIPLSNAINGNKSKGH